MRDFTIFPAIDLRDGQVVRLLQGKADKQKTYADQPEKIANEWIGQGAEWLHVVNLNGAFGEKTELNAKAIKKIVNAVNRKAKIQLGGGIRNMEQVRATLGLGVDRIVLGTAVIENPAFGKQVLDEFDGESIAFGFDALGGKLMTRGWQTNSGLNMFSLAEDLAEAGAKTLIYTNIKKDGMQTGVDWENARKLADRTGLEIIASGGTATLEDVAKVRSAGLAGVIIGKALYEKNFTLKEALNVR